MATGSTAAGPTPDPDRARRLFRLKLLAWAGGVVLLLLLLRGQFRHELYHLTGEASWMWVTGDVAQKRPVAGIFVRDFSLADRPRRAVAKICGDRQYTLWINGHLVLTGHNRPGFRLDVVQVTDLLRPGRNVIAVEAGSPTSVGAVLFALDLEPGPEGLRAGDPRGRSVIVSGPDWRVFTRWVPGVFDRAITGGDRPWIWGRPPDHPWSYPVPRLHEAPLVQSLAGEPRRITTARQAGEGCWRYELGEGFSGLVWVELPPGGPAGWSVVDDAWPAPWDRLDVVTVPGRRRWLLPSVWTGSFLILEGPARPPALEVVPVQER